MFHSSPISLYLYFRLNLRNENVEFVLIDIFVIHILIILLLFALNCLLCKKLHVSVIYRISVLLLTKHTCSIYWIFSFSPSAYLTWTSNKAPCIFDKILQTSLFNWENYIMMSAALLPMETNFEMLKLDVNFTNANFCLNWSINRTLEHETHLR